MAVDPILDKLIEAVKTLTEKNNSGASSRANANKFNPCSSYIPQRRANNSSTFTSTVL
jgi:hypothetical protein